MTGSLQGKRRSKLWDQYIGYTAYFKQTGQLIITNSRTIKMPHGSSEFVMICGYDQKHVNIMHGGWVSQIPKKYVIRPKV